MNFCIQLHQNGLYSAMPYLGRFVGAQILGFIYGMMLRNKFMKTINMQKMYAALSFLIPGVGEWWHS